MEIRKISVKDFIGFGRFYEGIIDLKNNVSRPELGSKLRLVIRMEDFHSL
jgi:CRISPR/Cas system-associated protein Csm6